MRLNTEIWQSFQGLKISMWSRPLLAKLCCLCMTAVHAFPAQAQNFRAAGTVASLSDSLAAGTSRETSNDAKLLNLTQGTILLAVETAVRHQMDPALVLALIEVESGFKSSAISPKGATGLMQLMPNTAYQYGLRRAADLHDPATNLDIGTRHLKDLLMASNGNLSLALASYNAGRGAIQKSGNTIPAYRETMLYVPAILGRIPVFQNLLLLTPSRALQ